MDVWIITLNIWTFGKSSSPVPEYFSHKFRRSSYGAGFLQLSAPSLFHHIFWKIAWEIFSKGAKNRQSGIASIQGKGFYRVV
jgi:hypothetical protein